ICRQGREHHTRQNFTSATMPTFHLRQSCSSSPLDNVKLAAECLGAGCLYAGRSAPSASLGNGSIPRMTAAYRRGPHNRCWVVWASCLFSSTIWGTNAGEECPLFLPGRFPIAEVKRVRALGSQSDRDSD